MKVMVTIDDDGEGSLYPLEWVIEHIADPAEKPPTIMVVHVQPPFQTYTPVPVGPALFSTAATMESVKHAQEASAAEVIARATKLCQQHKIKAEMNVVRGNLEEMIVETAEEMNADLLVVGSRGLSRIKRAFFGSVSDYCVHNANCPVLIVKPPNPYNY